MSEMLNVQEKIPCIFKTVVLEESSQKKKWQTFSVVAGSEPQEELMDIALDQLYPSEKVDGTCCCVKTFEGINDEPPSN